MPFHHCSIVQEDGTTVAQHVGAAIEETTRDGVTEWYATLTVTQLATLAAGHRYRLQLDDGRVGEFLVRRNTSTGGENRAVAVRGTGPLRAP
jgi:hypothetical protein